MVEQMITDAQILSGALKTLGMSQAALARRIGVTRSAINDVVTGRRGMSATVMSGTAAILLDEAAAHRQAAERLESAARRLRPREFTDYLGQPSDEVPPSEF